MPLIPNLPAAGSLSASDLLIKDTGSKTQKITVADVAKYFFGVDAIPTPSSVDDHYLIGVFFAQGSAVSGLPSSDSSFYRVVCFGRVQLCNKYLNSTNPGPVYFRQYTNSEWTPWGGVGTSTNAVMTIPNGGTGATTKDGALGNLGMHKFYVDTNEKTITLPNGYRGVLYITDSTAAKCGEYIINATNAGSTKNATIKAAIDLTITLGTNTLTLQATSGSRYALIIDINGTSSGY